MATWTTTLGEPGNMLLAFAFVDNPINNIVIGGAGATATVTNNTTFNAGNGGVLTVQYLSGGSLLSESSNSPASGNYQQISVVLGASGVGVLSGISPVRLFNDIDSTSGWRALDGNDTLVGDVDKDTLTGGYGGSDNFDGKSNDDKFLVAALSFAPSHVFTGGSGFDTVVVGTNIFDASLTTLDLRSASFSNVDALSVAAGLETHINATQVGANLLVPTTALSGGGTVHFHLPAAGTLDLGGMTNSGASVVVHGSTGVDTIFGTAGGERILGGTGGDVLAGNAGGDIFDYDALTDSGKKGSARDFISDFARGTDSIDLSTIDANGAKNGDKAFKFIKQKGFNDKAGELRYEKINKSGTANDVTVIEGDTNGNGKADFRIELKGLVSLDKADFVL